MYYVSKRMEISGAHFLRLNYTSKCSKVHGHNWIVTVHCRSNRLNENGMVVDFTEIKERIHGRLDHAFLNELEPFDKINPTAENIAHYICYQLSEYGCYKVEVQESEGNVAVYERDGGR